jgi:hypothetical protein
VRGASCPWLLEGNAVLVHREPRVECLEGRVELPGQLDRACAAVDLLEVPLELEHVAEVVGAGEAEAPEDLGRDVVVADRLPERPGEGGAPWAPANACFRLATSSTSVATTSAPSFASCLAFSDPGSRVSARAAKPPLGSFRIARTSPPPCAPVAPTTAIVFLSAISNVLSHPMRAGAHPADLERLRLSRWGDSNMA